MTIHAQLYTVRKKLTTNEEISSTLAAIRALGYDGDPLDSLRQSYGYLKKIWEE